MQDRLPLVYTQKQVCVTNVDLWSHLYVLACVVSCPLCVRRILTTYWQDVDYPACERMRPVWTSGGSHSTEEWWDNQTERQWERGGHMSGQRTMTINCLSQLTQTRHYQDPIIYRTTPNCDTNTQLRTYMCVRLPTKPSVFVLSLCFKNYILKVETQLLS